MAQNVTAIYNTVTQAVCMLVIDAMDLTDPSFNPPDCIQIPLDVATYESLPPEEVYPWIASVVESLQA